MPEALSSSSSTKYVRTEWSSGVFLTPIKNKINVRSVTCFESINFHPIPLPSTPAGRNSLRCSEFFRQRQSYEKALKLFPSAMKAGFKPRLHTWQSRCSPRWASSLAQVYILKHHYLVSVVTYLPAFLKIRDTMCLDNFQSNIQYTMSHQEQTWASINYPL